MLRRSFILTNQQQQKRAVPSLIAMLSNRASEINLTPEQQELRRQRLLLQQQQQKQQQEEKPSKLMNQQKQNFPSPNLLSVKTEERDSSNESQMKSSSEEDHLSLQKQEKFTSSSATSPRNPATVFSQLTLLKTEFIQEELNRKDSLEKYRNSLSSLDIQIEEMDRFSQIVTEEEEQQIEERKQTLLRARYHLKRKFKRCQVATPTQRRMILNVVNFLKSKHVRLSLDEIRNTLREQQQQQQKNSNNNNNSRTSSSTKALCQLVEDIGFFSGALRKMQKMIFYQQKTKVQQMMPDADDEEAARISKNVLLLDNVTLVGSKTKRQIQNVLCEVLSVERKEHEKVQEPENASSSSTNIATTTFSKPKEAITLLFSATKSGFLLSPSKFASTTNTPAATSSFDNHRLRVTEEILKTLLSTSFHPALFSAWDTLQLTMWLTAMMTSLMTTSSSSSSKKEEFVQILTLLHKMYTDLLLKHLWVQNASGLKGISAWLILSCIPQLQEAFSLLFPMNNNNNNNNIPKMIDQVVSTLVPECTKMLNAPISANQFAEPWNRSKNKNSGAATSMKGKLMRSESLNNLQDDDIFGVKPARVDSIENELSFKIGKNDPRKLMSILTLINSDSMRELAQQAERTERKKLKRRAENNITSENPERRKEGTFVRPQKLALPAQLSLARAVVYGSLARSLRLFSNVQQHISTLPDSSLLLLIASGPASEASSIHSRIEAASVANLIDSIYVQLYQISEAVIEECERNSNASATNSKKNCKNNINNYFSTEAQKQDFAIAIIRSLNCLAHLSRQGFLMGKRKFDSDSVNDNLDDRSFLADLRRGGSNYGRDGEVPRPKSRILSEQSGVGTTANSFSSSIHSQKERKELQLMFAKDQIVSRFFRALTDSGLINALPSLESIDALEKAIYSLGCLTNSRSRQLAEARDFKIRGSSSTSRLFSSEQRSSADNTVEEEKVVQEVVDNEQEKQEERNSSPSPQEGDGKQSAKRTAIDALKKMHERQKNRYSTMKTA